MNPYMTSTIALLLHDERLHEAERHHRVRGDHAPRRGWWRRRGERGPRRGDHSLAA